MPKGGNPKNKKIRSLPIESRVEIVENMNDNRYMHHSHYSDGDNSKRIVNNQASRDAYMLSEFYRNG